MKSYTKLIMVVFTSVCLSAAEQVELGNTVLTGFSGVKAPKLSEKFPKKIKTPRRSYMSRYDDELMINTDGYSAIVTNVNSSSEHLWDGSILPNKVKFGVKAKDVGQVFGTTFDDRGNIYLTATSFYGLNIVTSDLPNKLTVNKKPYITGDIDTRDERYTKGVRFAKWMSGQFGKGGGAGSVWKIDAKSGKVSKFADIKLNGVENSGSALGNIAFDSKHKEFFVSDLDTGMIHRLSMKGEDLGHFDHGVQARELHGLKPIIHNELDRININSANFNTKDITTWGYAQEGRRVYAVSVVANRLFYSVYNGTKAPSEIWSIGLDKSGDFTNDSRFELLVSGVKHNLPITDMIVTANGEMVLAQRALNSGFYNMKQLVSSTKAQVLKYHIKSPQDGYLNRWYPEAKEYYSSLKNPYRGAMGGVSLGYGYDENGSLDIKNCTNRSLWISSENILKGSAFDGAIGQPFVLSSVNKPPKLSNSISSPTLDYSSYGHIGDIEVFAKACSCVCKEVDFKTKHFNKKGAAKMGKVRAIPLTEGMTPPPYYTPYDPYSLYNVPNVPIGDVGLDGINIGMPIMCLIVPSLCNLGDNTDDTTNEPQKACMSVKTSPPGPFLQSDGSWLLPLYGIVSNNNMNIDSMQITPVAGVSSIANGDTFAVGTPQPKLVGASAGSFAILNLCGYDSTKVVPGQPHECCNVKIKVKIGQEGNQTLEVLK